MCKKQTTDFIGFNGNVLRIVTKIVYTANKKAIYFVYTTLYKCKLKMRNNNMSIDLVKKLAQIQKPSKEVKGGATRPANNDLQNLSVFDYAKKYSSTGASSSTESEEMSQKEIDMQNAKGEKATSEAKEQKKGALSLAKSGETLTGDIAGDNKKAQTEATKLEKKISSLAQKFKKNDKALDKLQAQEEIQSTELATLLAQRESLSTFDGTGSGADSAYSLNIGGNNQQGNNPFVQTASKSNDNSSEITSLDSQIATLTQQQGSTQQQITTHTSTNKNFLNQLSGLKDQTLMKARQVKAETAKAEKQAQTTQTIGTVTTTVGGAVTALGAILTACVYTAPAGAGATAAGTAATSAGAQALSVAGKIMSAAGTFQSTAGTAFTQLATKTKTTKK